MESLRTNNFEPHRSRQTNSSPETLDANLRWRSGRKSTRKGHPKFDSMRRYHFDLVDTKSVAGVTGAILDDNHAIKVLLEIARDAPRLDLVGHGHKIPGQERR